MSKLFRELWVGKGRQWRYVQAMNPMVDILLRRNIASLIRRGGSVKLRRPMDSEGVGSTSGQRSVTEMVPTTPAEGSTKPVAQEDRGHEEEAASIMIGLPESTAGQPAAAQEKKKQRQFDFSMSVFY